MFEYINNIINSIDKRISKRKNKKTFNAFNKAGYGLFEIKHVLDNNKPFKCHKIVSEEK